MSKLNLKELEELAKKATQGEWKEFEYEGCHDCDSFGINLVDGTKTDFMNADKDQEFVLALVNAFPSILLELKELQRLRDKYDEV